MNKTKSIIFRICAIMIVVGAVVYSFNVDIAKILLAAGAVGYSAITFTSPYKGKSIRGKRLFNIQIFAAILMAVSAFLMLIDNKGWPVTLLIAAIQTLYCAIVLPKIYEKEQRGEDDNSSNK